MSRSGVKLYHKAISRRGLRYHRAFLRLVLGPFLIVTLTGFGTLGPANEPAPDFTFTLYHGENELDAERLNLSDLRGRPIVLNLWGAQCPPCRAEMPEFQRFYEGFKDKVRLLGIDVGEFTDLGSQDDARKLLDELGITYPTGYPDDSRLLRHYRVLAMPTTIFINAEGQIFRKWNGVLNMEKLKTITTNMLNQ